MSTNKFKKRIQSNAKLMAAYATIFLLSFTVLALSSATDAEASCGTEKKYNAAGFLDESGDRWGNESKLKVNAASICGTSSTNSYAHLSNGGFTSGSSEGDDFIEAGMFKGNQAGFSTSSDIHYFMLVQNFWDNPQKRYFDLTDTFNITPSTGDTVKVTLHWTHNTGFPAFQDMYKLVIDNESNNDSLTVNDVWVNGRGTQMTVQSEKLNQDSEIKGTATNARDYSTSETWSSWTDSSGSVIPDEAGNTMCFVKNSDSSYAFGEESGGGCDTT